MARIPTADSLERPQIAADRPVATIGPAEQRAISAPATALMEVGHSMAGASEELRKKKEQDEGLEADLRAMQYERDAQQRLDKERREMQQGGTGFTQTFRSSYDEGARAVARQAAEDGLSFHARQRLNYRLLSGAERLEYQAQRYQLDEEDRFNRETVSSQLSDYIDDVRNSPSRETLERTRRLGELYIKRSPLNPAHRYTMLDRFHRGLEQEWRAALVARAAQSPSGADAATIDLYGGGTPPAGAIAAPRVPNRAGRAFTTPEAAPEAIPGERPAPRGPGGPAAPGAPGTIPALGGEPAAEARSAPSPGVPGAAVASAVTAPATSPATSPPSPLEIRTPPGNREPRTAGVRAGAPEGIVLHHTGGGTLASALETNASAGTGYNYYVDRDGSVYRLAGDDVVMRHVQPRNGRSPTGQPTRNGRFPDLDSANTIAIAAVARSDADITPAQRASMTQLVQQLAGEHHIPAASIIGHGDIQGGPVRGRAAREDTEGSLAREFREGRIPLAPGGPSALGAPAAADGTPAAASGPSGGAPSGAPDGVPDLTDDQRRLAEDAQATVGMGYPGPARPMRLGSPEWAEARQAEIERAAAEGRPVDAGGVRLTATTAPQFRSTLNQINAARQRFITPLNQRIQSWETGAREGRLPPAAEVAQTRADVEETGNYDLAQNFNYMLALAQTTQAMRRMPPVQMEAVVRDEEARQARENATELDIKRLSHMKTLLKNARDQVNADPNGWAHTVGLADFSAPIDFANDASMRTHAEAARRVGRYLGQEPRFFSPAQRDEAKDRLRQGGQPALDMLSSMVRNWGAGAPSAIREIAGTDHELAYIASAYAESQRSNGAGMQAIGDAMHAIEARRDPNTKKTYDSYAPRAADLRDAASFLGPTFRLDPNRRDGLIAATTLVYEHRASQQNIPSFNTTLWRQIATELLGQSTDRNVTYGGLYFQGRALGGIAPWHSNSPIQVPPNVRQDGVPALLDGLRDQDLHVQWTSDLGDAVHVAGPVDGRGNPLGAADVRRGWLFSDGRPGRYRVSQTGDFDRPNWMRDPSQPDGIYRLDLPALEPALRPRMPQLYQGEGAPPTTENRLIRAYGGAQDTGALSRLPAARDLPAPILHEFRRQFIVANPDATARREIERNPDRYGRELDRFIADLRERTKGLSPEEMQRMGLGRLRPVPAASATGAGTGIGVGTEAATETGAGQ
jgi:hypothetical protein